MGILNQRKHSKLIKLFLVVAIAILLTVRGGPGGSAGGARVEPAARDQIANRALDAIDTSLERRAPGGLATRLKVLGL